MVRAAASPPQNPSSFQKETNQNKEDKEGARVPQRLRLSPQTDNSVSRRQTIIKTIIDSSHPQKRAEALTQSNKPNHLSQDCAL
mmetsp:Transcript_27726/g.45119  ORF Transcript_27726/g.45119 Transcript_27726/m.45119 type:complete len:84 (-) Transcript_27726:155-406(-)